MLSPALRISVLLPICACLVSLDSNEDGLMGTPFDVGYDHASEPAVATIAENDTVPGGLTAADWSSIHTAYEAGRHAAFAVDGGGFRARNPGQQWTTRFDGRGFLTEPDAGSWTWGLELESYGFPGAERVVANPSSLTADGGRVSYEWDTALEEWYVNDTRGLEHGYTLRRRPGGEYEAGKGPLTFTLGVRGELYPKVDADGRGVSFLDDVGATALTYTKLCVFDAEGPSLEAWFQHASNGLLLSIDEEEALYPLTIDPVAQQAYLKASNTDPGDQFGHSVAVSGDTVVIGAPGEQSTATGVNGDQSSNHWTSAGAAYVFVRNGATWSQQAYLKSSNTGYDDHFGHSVAVDGDLIVVGAPHEDSGATGVNGNQLDESKSRSGAAYAFVRHGTTWSQQAYLKASNTGHGDFFGYSVAVSGNTVVVGAQLEKSNATGVNGSQSDNSATAAGAAYVFSRTAGVWAQHAYLKASNTDPSDLFGFSVSICGDLAVVGAHGEDSGAGGVNADQSDNSSHGAGAAYVFVRQAGSWSQRAYLKATHSRSNNGFGRSVAVSRETVVIGARSEDGGSTGVNGNPNDTSAKNAGAAYVFVRRGTTWSQQAYLKASNTNTMDLFGTSVAVSDDTVVIGAPSESSIAVGVNGMQDDNSASRAGAAYVFVRRDSEWSQKAYLKASNTDTGDNFGISVAVSGDLAVICARGEDSGAIGIGGDQFDNGAAGSGAAYTFDLEAPQSGYSFCFGDPGSGTPCPCNNDNDGSIPGSGCDNGYFASGAQLKGSGLASISADSLVLICTHVEPFNASLYVQGNNDLSPGTVWGDGIRCVGGDLKRLQIRFSDGSGTSTSTTGLAALAGNVMPGDIKYYQCWYWATENPPCGDWVHFVNTSNGYTVTWLP